MQLALTSVPARFSQPCRPGRDAHPVRVFATFTEDLQKLADWLVACGITTLAMGSTGVY